MQPELEIAVYTTSDEIRLACMDLKCSWSLTLEITENELDDIENAIESHRQEHNDT